MVLVFGSQLKANVYVNGKHIEQVENPEYLGNILTTVQSHKGDIFSKHYDYVSGQSCKAMFSIKIRLKSVGQLPPWIQIHLFGNLMRPILLYGSDVCGVNVSANTPIDKVVSYYMLCVMTNVQYDFIDDAERELLSPLQLLPTVLLMFKRVSFIFCNGFTLFHILHCVTYTLLCLYVTCMILWKALSEMTK